MYLVKYHRYLFELADELNIYSANNAIFENREHAGQFIVKRISPYLCPDIQDVFTRSVVEIRFPYAPEESKQIQSKFSDKDLKRLIAIEELSVCLDIQLSDAFYSFGFIQTPLLKTLLKIYERAKISYSVKDLTQDYFEKGSIYNFEFQQMIDLYIAKLLTEKTENLDLEIQVFIENNSWEKVYLKFLEIANKSNHPKLIQMARLFDPYKIVKEDLKKIDQDSRLAP